MVESWAVVVQEEKERLGNHDRTFIVFAGFERKRQREKLHRPVKEEIYKQNLEAS